MTIQPWRATCIQTKSKLAVKATDRSGAWATINENVAHVIGLIDAATAQRWLDGFTALVALRCLAGRRQRSGGRGHGST